MSKQGSGLSRLSRPQQFLLGGGLLLLATVLVFWVLIKDKSTSEIVEAPTPLPANTLHPTPIPTPSPTLSPIPLPELHLSSDAPNNQLPGDSNSQAIITTELLHAETVDTAALEIFFEVQGGGSIAPARLPLNTTPLQTIYTAGESSDIKDVQITALVDIPSVGRISASLTLQLIYQELILEMPCGYAFNLSPDPQPIPFRVLTNDGSPGSYRLRAFLQNPPIGDLRSEITGMGSTQIQFVAEAGDLNLYYTPPTQPEIGATHLCVSVVDRPSMGDQCIPIVWGRGTQLETRVRPISTWRDGTWAVVWADSLSGDTYRPNGGFISYDVLLSNISPDTAHLLQDKTPWEPKQCRVLDDLLVSGSSNLSLEPMNHAGLLRFNITIPGVDGQATTQQQLTLLGAEQLSLRNNNAILYTPADSPTPRASFTFDGNQPDIEYFYLLSTQAFDSQQPETVVLVRLYAPAEILDIDTHALRLPEGGTPIALTTSPENYTIYGGQTNVILNIIGNHAPDVYVDPNSILVNDETWHAIYFFARVATSDVRRYN